MNILDFLSAFATSFRRSIFILRKRKVQARNKIYDVKWRIKYQAGHLKTAKDLKSGLVLLGDYDYELKTEDREVIQSAIKVIDRVINYRTLKEINRKELLDLMEKHYKSREYSEVVKLYYEKVF